MSWLDTALSAARTVADAAPAAVLGLVFAVVWPIAGFPWWPLALVLGLGVVLRVLGFGYLIADRRGPILLVALLVVTTLLRVDAVVRGHRPGCWARPSRAGPGLLRWQLLALGMVLFLGAGVGAGWVAETVITAPGAGGGLGADQRVQPGPSCCPAPAARRSAR